VLGLFLKGISSLCKGCLAKLYLENGWGGDAVTTRTLFFGLGGDGSVNQVEQDYRSVVRLAKKSFLL